MIKSIRILLTSCLIFASAMVHSAGPGSYEVQVLTQDDLVQGNLSLTCLEMQTTLKALRDVEAQASAGSWWPIESNTVETSSIHQVAIIKAINKLELEFKALKCETMDMKSAIPKGYGCCSERDHSCC
jgi:hypothetical protein